MTQGSCAYVGVRAKMVRFSAFSFRDDNHNEAMTDKSLVKRHQWSAGPLFKIEII